MPDKSCPTTDSAADFLPRTITLQTLAAAARKCRGCPLYCHATQAVFGEGPKSARLFLIGEQPGDHEDLAGKPFVGPAGRLLDECLAAAKIDRSEVYLTNAVKHFKWQPRGKRRIHSKPTWTEIMACQPWLIEELKLIRPTIVICLGATASQSLLGKTFRLTQHRREILVSPYAPRVLATVHPSSLLRIPDQTARHAARKEFIADLIFAMKQASRRAEISPKEPLMKTAKIKTSAGQFHPLLKSNSVQAALMVLQPGSSSSENVENEHPKAEQWLFVVSGSGRATIGNRTLKISAHALLLIEKGEKHKITNTGKSPLVTLNFYSPPAYGKNQNVLRGAANQ